MRYEDDIRVNTARRMEINMPESIYWKMENILENGNQLCRAGAALLNDNAPDSELSDMNLSLLGSSNFCSLQFNGTHFVLIHLYNAAGRIVRTPHAAAHS